LFDARREYEVLLERASRADSAAADLSSIARAPSFDDNSPG
jgi:hypothetical protein